MKEFKWTKRTKAIAISAAIYAILALFVIIVCNNDTISNWIRNVLSVLSPIIVGLAIAYICTPVLTLFESTIYKGIKSPKLRRALSMICTYLMIALIITIILIIIIPQLISSIKNFTNDFKSYIDKTVTLINIMIYRINIAMDGNAFSQYVNLSDLQKIVSDMFANVGGVLSAISNYVLTYTTSIATGIKNIVFGLFFSIYILSSKERLLAQVKKIFAAILNEDHYQKLSEMAKFTDKSFGNYIKAQLLDALLVAIWCAIAFSIAGIPYSVLLAFIIGVTNIIPIFGPFIGGIPAAAIVFITTPGKLIPFIIILVLIQQIDGNFILPRLIGSSTGISSLGVLCAITIMGGYFGIMGMILGVPVFVVGGELIKRLVNSKLEQRGLSLELAEYYSSDKNSIIEKTDHNDHLIVRLVNVIVRMFKSIFSKIKSIFNKKQK